MDMFYVITILVLAFLYVLWKAFFAPIPYRKGTPHGQKKKVVVIGAGVSGIACAKEMMDEGHEVVIYEKNNNYGGLWSFSATDRSSARVYDKLITNSSAMVMAFSDHPPVKERFDDETREYHHDFPYHYTPSQYKTYVDSYIDKYGIRKVWKLGHSVQKMTPLKGDRWRVTVRNESKQEQFETDCDFVAVCTGQHHCANDLSQMVPGMKDFPGVKIHSRNFADAKAFTGKKVIVIGGGDSAADLVRYCAEVSPGNVYHSVRSGAHVIPRYFLYKETPFDYMITRFSMYIPTQMYLEDRDKRYPKILRKMANDGDKVCQEIMRLYDMNGHPERAYFGTKSAFGCQSVASGEAILKTALKQMKGTTAIFQKNTSNVKVDDSPVENVDAVLFCTGYVPRYEFLPTKALAEHPHHDRFSLVWHTELKNVAFIGFARPAGLGAIPPLAEAQSRWAAQVLSGKVTLPSPEHMRKCNAKMRAHFAAEHPKINTDSTGHLIVFSYYLAHICSKFGASPNMGKLFFTNRKLFWDLLVQPFTPMQFRIHGPHAQPELAEKVIANLTTPKQVAELENWRSTSIKIAWYNILSAMGVQGFQPGYSDAYGGWSDY